MEYSFILRGGLMKLINPKKLSVSFILYFFLMSITFFNGIINGYALIQFQDGVSHHTGNMSKFAIALFDNPKQGIFLAGLILCYFLGALSSGMVSENKPMGYALAPRWMLFFGGIAICGLHFIQGRSATLFLSFFSGLINAMLESEYGSLYKTTHITGHLTEAGFALGELAKGDMKYGKSFFTSISFLFFFFLGGVVAFLLSLIFNYTLLIVGGGWIILSIIYHYMLKYLRQNS